MMLIGGWPIFVGTCCRQWICAAGSKGSCGLCGERPQRITKPGDCCPTSYDCPTTGERECLEHGGFYACCAHPLCPGKRVR